MNEETKRVLLISNSTLYGSGYLDHAESEIRDFLGDAKKALFVPSLSRSDPNSTHMGETQEERILQSLEENDTPVADRRCDGRGSEVSGAA